MYSWPPLPWFSLTGGGVVHRLLTVNNLDDTTSSTQTTLQTRKYIAPQGAKELCLTQFSQVSNETDRIFFLPTTSPFEWQSFLPRQPLSAPSDHNPAWLERRSHEIIISHVCLNSYSRTSKKLKSMSNATTLPPVFGLSGEWGCLIDGH